MRNFKAAKAFIREILDDANYPIEQVDIYPGPELQDGDANTYVLLTRYGGAGLDGGEGILDNYGWQVRVVGAQYEYDVAEGVADAIDIGLISFMSDYIGEGSDRLWVVEIPRVGGPPAALMTDNANRTHFVCSYMPSVESALAP
jgi:hypothetical protein